MSSEVKIDLSFWNCSIIVPAENALQLFGLRILSLLIYKQNRCIQILVPSIALDSKSKYKFM